MRYFRAAFHRSGAVGVVLLLASSLGTAGGASAQELWPSLADVEQRDILVTAQESLLNVYRCKFSIDTVVVPGGCSDGRPASPTIGPRRFAGTPTWQVVEERDALISAQEALLNVYRCMFDIDTSVVPGGCSPEPVDALPGSSSSCDFSEHAGNAVESVWQVEAGESLGTAFHLGRAQNRQWWLTAEHVVRGNSTASLTHSGRSISAQVVTASRLGDIAVLSTEEAPSAWLRLGISPTIQPGSTIYAIGYPLFRASTPAVSRGVVSRFLDDPFLGRIMQTDTSVSPGHSGGPMLDVCGRVTGMVVSKAAAESAEGVNFSIAEAALQQALLNAQARLEQTSEPLPDAGSELADDAELPNSDQPEIGEWQEDEYANGEKFLWFIAYRDEQDAGIIVFEYPCDDDNWNMAFWVWKWDRPVRGDTGYLRVWSGNNISSAIPIKANLVQHFADGSSRFLLEREYESGGPAPELPLRISAELLDDRQNRVALISILRTETSVKELAQSLTNTRSSVSC